MVLESSYFRENPAFVGRNPCNNGSVQNGAEASAAVGCHDVHEVQSFHPLRDEKLQGNNKAKAHTFLEFAFRHGKDEL